MRGSAPMKTSHASLRDYYRVVDTVEALEVALKNAL
jgi:hypothetical protein